MDALLPQHEEQTHEAVGYHFMSFTNEGFTGRFSKDSNTCRCALNSKPQEDSSSEDPECCEAAREAKKESGAAVPKSQQLEVTVLISRVEPSSLSHLLRKCKQCRVLLQHEDDL